MVMETLRIIEHGNGHTDFEAKIFGEWVVVKCILEDTMQYRLTASRPNKPTESSVYFTRHAAEIAQRVYEADGYTVTIEELKS